MAAAQTRSTTTFSAHWSDVLDAAQSAGIDEEHALVLLEELALRAEERAVPEAAPRVGLLRRLGRRALPARLRQSQRFRTTSRG